MKQFKEGDEVQCLTRGAGVVYDVYLHDTSRFPIKVSFGDNIEDCYTFEGHMNNDDVTRSLYHKSENVKVTFDQSIEKDTLVWIWDHNESTKVVRFATGEFVNGKIETYEGGGNSECLNRGTNTWDNFEIYEV